MFLCGILFVANTRNFRFLISHLEDLNALHGMLHETQADMTRWDVYQAEVDSGHLQWSIVHTEKFFRENAKRMEGKDGNFAIVKVRHTVHASAHQSFLPTAFAKNSHLIIIFYKTLRKLAAGEDEEIAAIACYDIGEFVRHYPNGRAIAKRLGIRNVVMNLIESTDPELQRQALQCISKMLVQNWQVCLPW